MQPQQGQPQPPAQAASAAGGAASAASAATPAAAAAATAAPSPQSVGREFVRQYYTLLHQAPLHLHRFYSHNSSFIHGGLADSKNGGANGGGPDGGGSGGGGPSCEPVRGQQEIHQKIMQLNFRECHAKIRQVDAHSTLGSGVVVQVG